MSILDDARRLADTDPGVADICFACGNDSGKHYDDCPWLAMPRIVAALEAAETTEGRLVYLVSRLKALVTEHEGE